MKRSSIIATTALGAALTLGAVGIGTAVLPGAAGAQTTTTQADSSTAAGKLANHPRLRQLVKEEGTIAAQTIGISPKELRSDVKGGQSVAEVAQAHGVDPQTVVDAVVKDLDAKLDKAVADGKVTQERATKIEDRLPTRIDKLVNHHRGDHTAQG